DEVRRGGERPVRRHRPALDRALPVVGDAAPHRGGEWVAVHVSDVCGRDEAGDLGGDRRRRVAALFLPALRAERWAVRDQEVGGRAEAPGGWPGGGFSVASERVHLAMYAPCVCPNGAASASSALPTAPPWELPKPSASVRRPPGPGVTRATSTTLPFAASE